MTQRIGWWNQNLFGGGRMKYHYTLDGEVSLCRRYCARFVPDEAFDIGLSVHPDNCVACERRLVTIQRKRFVTGEV